MPRVQLCIPNGGSCTAAKPEDVAQLSEAFDGLCAPRAISATTLLNAVSRFSDWEVTAGGRKAPLTITEWMQQLVAPQIDSDFKKKLAEISGSRKLPQHRSALEPFNVGRFCEFRAALAAERLRMVSWVKIVRQNSELDRSKVDVLVGVRRSHYVTPIQVKAGRGIRCGKSMPIPRLHNVWVRSYEDLQDALAKILEARRITRDHR